MHRSPIKYILIGLSNFMKNFVGKTVTIRDMSGEFVVLSQTSHSKYVEVVVEKDKVRYLISRLFSNIKVITRENHELY